MIDIDYYRLISIIGLSINFVWFYSMSLPKKSAHFRVALRDFWRIDLIHDARYLRTRLRIDGI